VYKTQFDAQVEKDRTNAPHIKSEYAAGMMNMTAEDLLKDKDFYNALEDYFV